MCASWRKHCSVAAQVTSKTAIVTAADKMLAAERNNLAGLREDVKGYKVCVCVCVNKYACVTHA